MAEMKLSVEMWERFSREVTNFVVGVANVAAPDFQPSNQKMLLMVGYPGSGKSTIAKQLIAAQANLARVNQDEMGTRKACEHAARMAFGKGQNVIVDRCNFDYQQRNVWLKLALERGCNDVRCLLLNIPIEVCKSRVLVRTDHPTLGANQESLQIVQKFVSTFVPPLKEEGFTEIISVENDEQIEAAVQSILVWSRTTVLEFPQKQKPNRRELIENNDYAERKQNGGSRHMNPWSVLSGPVEAGTSSEENQT